MATVQDEAPIGMSLVVKPVMKMTVNEGEAGEADGEAVEAEGVVCVTLQ